MKRLLLSALMLLPLALGAQNHHFVVKDTAAHVVDTYLRMLNFDALPDDSTLFLETTITSPSSSDTLVMRRWFAKPEMHRVEVWHADSLLTGYCSNGTNRFRKFISILGYWEDLEPDIFRRDLRGYDFRGPFHQWHASGLSLQWKGITNYKNQPLQAIRATSDNSYDRYYFFDPNNNLLTLILEDSTINEISTTVLPSHIEWKVYHEYQPLGECLIPSLESFLRGTTLTILATKPRFLPRNTLIFNRDR